MHSRGPTEQSSDVLHLQGTSDLECSTLLLNHTFLFDLNILVNKADFSKSNGHNKTRKPGCHWMSHGTMLCNKFFKSKTLTF